MFRKRRGIEEVVLGEMRMQLRSSGVNFGMPLWMLWVFGAKFVAFRVSRMLIDRTSIKIHGMKVNQSFELFCQNFHRVSY